MEITLDYTSYLNSSLELCQHILQRKRLYSKDYNYILVCCKICVEYYKLNKDNENSKKIYSKAVLILDKLYSRVLY